MKTTQTRWRWLALFLVMAMVAAACTRETSDTTEAGEDSATTQVGAADTTEGEAEPTAAGFTYTVGIFEDPNTDNPWAAIDTESDVWTNYTNPDMASLYTYQGPTYTLIPLLAADDSPPALEADGDNYSVTVNLRDDVTWSDGEPIDAGDIVFTFETVEKYGGLGGNFLTQWPLATDPVEDDPATDEDETATAGLGILSVEALDTQTVKITFNFEAGLAVWPFATGVASIYPEHFWGPTVDENDSFEGLYARSGLGAPNASGMVSSQREPGAFWRNNAVADYWDRGSRYTVYDNGSVEYTNASGTTETYGGDPRGEVVADYIEGPHASETVFSRYSDQSSAVLALTEGEVDFLLNPLGLQRGLQDLVLAEPDLNVTVNEQNHFRYLAFNMRKFPMSELSFRQAIACRIDKEFMANSVLSGAAISVNSLVPPGNSFWANPDLTGICEGQEDAQRFETAKQILLDAGWTWDVEPEWDEDNRDVIPRGEGLRGPDGTTVQALELLAPGPGYDPLRSTYALWIEEWTVDLGIPLTAETTGFSVIIDEVLAVDEGALEWDMYILGWRLTPFPDHVFDFFTTGNDSADGGLNTPGYSNPEFDALAADFKSARTLEEARDLIFRGDAIINDDLPYVVLFANPIIEAYRNTIEFPFTTVLGGLQNFSLEATVTSS